MQIACQKKKEVSDSCYATYSGPKLVSLAMWLFSKFEEVEFNKY